MTTCRPESLIVLGPPPPRPGCGLAPANSDDKPPDEGAPVGAPTGGRPAVKPDWAPAPGPKPWIWALNVATALLSCSGPPAGGVGGVVWVPEGPPRHAPGRDQERPNGRGWRPPPGGRVICGEQHEAGKSA